MNLTLGIENILNTIDTVLVRKYLSLTSISAVRAGIGLVGFFYYLTQYQDRRYYWGPQGIYDWKIFIESVGDLGTFNLYAINNSMIWFEIVYHCGLAISLLVILGIGTRATLVLHGIFIWSIYQRNTLLLDGGDNLVYLVIPFLCLTSCYSHFKIEFQVFKLSSKIIPTWLSCLVHNIGVIGFSIQLLLLYVSSGLYKAQGKLWQEGTAIYYIMRVPEFTWPGISEKIYTNDILVPVMTYSATLLLIFFPFLILNKHLRFLATLSMITFHLGIAVLMGLTGFALTMIACDMVFLNPELEKVNFKLRRTTKDLGSETSNDNSKKLLTSGKILNHENYT